MQALLLKARRGSEPPQAVLACVARGSATEAEALALAELARAGWQVLEVVPSEEVRRRMPGLKRLPLAAATMASARTRGMALAVIELPED